MLASVSREVLVATTAFLVALSIAWLRESLRPAGAAPLRVGPSTIHGRGVFATCDVAPGETLEFGSVLVFPKEGLGGKNLLVDYVFYFDDVSIALLLGQSSLCNHDTDPNAEVSIDRKKMSFILRSRRSIRTGDEILVHYGPRYWTKR